jgi:hypothetical protein
MKWTQLEKEFEKLVQRKLNQKEEERKKAIEQLELQVRSISHHFSFSFSLSLSLSLSLTIFKKKT